MKADEPGSLLEALQKFKPKDNNVGPCMLIIILAMCVNHDDVY